MTYKKDYTTGKLVKSSEVNNNFKILQGMAADTATPLFIYGENLTGQINGILSAFITAYYFRDNSICVYVDGLKLVRTTHYAENTALKTITLTFVPIVGQTLTVDYIRVNL